MHGNLLPLVSTGITVCLALESLFGAQAAKPVFVQGADGRIALGTATVFPGKNPAGNVSAQSAKVSVPTQPGAPVVPRYPLRRSANNRYFIDQNNVPFMVIGDSPQSLFGNLTSTQQNTYFSNRVSKGFNTVWINIPCANYTACNANGTTYDGVKPFTSGTSPADYDLATPNSTYFARVDAMINLAATYGMVVFYNPCETGSFLTTLLNNGETKAFNYGVYVGNRYKDFPNIVWFHGNDFGSWQTEANNRVVGEVMRGIASVDSNHLQTVQIQDGSSAQTAWSTQNTYLLTWLTANLAYTYSPAYYGILQAYNDSTTLPVFLGEGHYENEGHVENGTPYVLRETAYWTLTYGGIGGYLYGDFYTWRSEWTSDPSTLLNSPGAADIAHINTLFAEINWWNLVPDQTHVVVTSGYGSCPAASGQASSTTSCCTTSYVTNSTSVTYCSKNSSVTVDMTKFGGPVTARKYDPSNGTFTTFAGSPFANTGTRNFALSGNNSDGDPDWILLLQARAAVSDFDGDGKTDLSVFRPSNGYWYINQSSNNSFVAQQFGASGDLIAPGDYDGDGRTNFAVFRPTTGYWYNSLNPVTNYGAIQFGVNGDIAATGDFDGDGKSDICVYRQSNGTFYLLHSSDGSFHFQQWGQIGDLPLMGDYDGDSKTDFAIFRPSIGAFYILLSSSGSVKAEQFGVNGDKPIAGNFDGDGKTDIAVYRPTNGTWYWLRSSDNSFRGVNWGTSGDVPAAGDYDGDGKWDVAVFRPSTGVFYILQSTTNALRAERFGAIGDVPVPSANVP